jgi:hypothetical protein
MQRVLPILYELIVYELIVDVVLVSTFVWATVFVSVP